MTDVEVVDDYSKVVPGEVSRLKPLLSRRLSSVPGIVHGVTFRVSGLGNADGNVGLGAPLDATDAWAMRQAWASAIGFELTTIVGLRQVHGSNVCVATAADAGKGATPGSEPAASADALITNDPGVTLMTLHADCLPILVVDPDLPAVAAIHSGWRGTVADVAGSTIKAMQANFGSDPSRLAAFLGPSIGPCCYQVGDEVANAWNSRNGHQSSQALVKKQGEWTLDLRAANSQLLVSAGLNEANIEISDVCTKCNGDNWFSHRGQGPDTGRFAAFIAIEQARA
jgi:purine-nucleoside/S-methyl-5'-thioadenosine phosphorylase / adenosine deaminase